MQDKKKLQRLVKADRAKQVVTPPSAREKIPTRPPTDHELETEVLLKGLAHDEERARYISLGLIIIITVMWLDILAVEWRGLLLEILIAK
jgi:hypothetical protein